MDTMPVVVRSIPPILPTLQIAEAFDAGPEVDRPVSTPDPMINSYSSTLKRLPVVISLAKGNFQK